MAKKEMSVQQRIEYFRGLIQFTDKEQKDLIAHYEYQIWLLESK